MTGYDGGAVEAYEKDKQRQKVLYEQIIAASKSCQNYRIYEKSTCRHFQWGIRDFL